MTTKLERLLEKEAQLKAQIQQAKAAERTLEKKRDTRRKILIGAAVMARVEHGDWPKNDLLRMMDGFLTRQNERDLFGLDAVVDEADGGKKKAAKKKPQLKATVQQEKAAAGVKTSGHARSGLAEPDFDVDTEFNL